jgi:hypothetical protein
MVAHGEAHGEELLTVEHETYLRRDLLAERPTCGETYLRRDLLAEAHFDYQMREREPGTPNARLHLAHLALGCPPALSLLQLSEEWLHLCHYLIHSIDSLLSS